MAPLLKRVSPRIADHAGRNSLRVIASPPFADAFSNDIATAISCAGASPTPRATPRPTTLCQRRPRTFTAAVATGPPVGRLLAPRCGHCYLLFCARILCREPPGPGGAVCHPSAKASSPICHVSATRDFSRKFRGSIGFRVKPNLLNSLSLAALGAFVERAEHVSSSFSGLSLSRLA